LGEVERGREKDGFNCGALSSRLPRLDAHHCSVCVGPSDGPATKTLLEIGLAWLSLALVLLEIWISDDAVMLWDVFLGSR